MGHGSLRRPYIGNPNDMSIKLWVNDVLKQNSTHPARSQYVGTDSLSQPT